MAEDGSTIYVGKAKRLRRRLQQYRNAKRCKKHHKMREVLKNAVSLRMHPCADDLAALLLENELIQTLRPRYNVSGAFSFLYPVIGLRREGHSLVLAYSTTPASYPMFELHGAYRSRYITREAYFALVLVFEYLGHREPKQRLAEYPREKYSHVSAFRQVSDHWLESLKKFLRGESHAFLEDAVMYLLERPMARRNAAEVQEMLNHLKRFFRFEARALKQALEKNGELFRFVLQEERDRIFLKSKYDGRREDTAVSSGS